MQRLVPEMYFPFLNPCEKVMFCFCGFDAQTPSSDFWKELALAMPRRVTFYSQAAGDPQTVLQEDEDPMLTLDPDYLDCRSDTDPAGDLGKLSSHFCLGFSYLKHLTHACT